MGLAALAAAVIAAVVLLVPSEAHSAPVPPVPSFNESSGCQDLNGIRGPLARAPGVIPADDPIYGPWGDFYGRTWRLARNQGVVVNIPGLGKNLIVHQRVVPAFQRVVANLEEAAANGLLYPHTNNSWSWNQLTIPPHRRMSFHAVGAAIDINSHANPYRADNVLITDMPEWYRNAWRDAGWCWGGDWQNLKDPMHFSWKGPIHTAGYVMPPPQPPLVGAANFTSAYDLGVGLLTPAPAGATHHLSDIDRDGAIDVVRVERWGSGRVALVAALARNAHDVANVQAVTATAPIDASAATALADLTRDGRPDLVYLLPGSDGTLALQVFPLTQSGSMPSTLIATLIPFTGSEVILFDDHDRDGNTDVFVIAPGSPATLRVWLGPGFTQSVGPVTMSVPSAGHRFAIGDRNVDGGRDLFALRDDGRLTVHFGPGYTSTQTLQTSFAPSPGDGFFVADLDGDGHSDLFLVKPNGATVMRRGGASGHHPGVWYEWTAGDTPAFACPTSFLDGTFASTAQVGLVDPATGRWCVRGAQGQLRSFYYGNPGDVPFVGDWNCNGVATPGLYRQADGFVYLRNSNTQGSADIRFFFGNPGDIPIAGDFNGNGCDTVSVYRPSTGQVFIVNELGGNGGGLGAADLAYHFGNPGDTPLAGDFNGNGTDTVGLHRASTGLVYYRNDHRQGPAHHQFFFGNPGDRFVVGDWNGDGVDTPGLFRPSQRAIHLRHSNTPGGADEVIRFGSTNWLPVAGRFGAP